MNEEHLAFCASEDWAEILQQHILPWALDGRELGSDVVELGAGPGLSTDVLRQRVERLTAVELDPALAAELAQRLEGTNVEVIQADGSRLPLESDRFSAATCFTMLHHVPSVQLQDAILSELARVLRPGGLLVGTDSIANPDLRRFHDGDVYVPVDPEALTQRLEDAGLVNVEVVRNEHDADFRFTGFKPA